MNWCLSANQTDEYLKKAEEIKIYWYEISEKPDIFNLIEINPHARILIRLAFNLLLTEQDYQWLTQQLILCKNNMAVIVSDNIQANYCKKFNIPFFFAYPARTFLQLRRMENYGATDAYIEDMLAHSLQDIKKNFKIKIRILCNYCGWDAEEGIWDGVEGSWFRPEDLYDLWYIDSAEFYLQAETMESMQAQEQALYNIYAVKHEWPGELNKIIFNLKNNSILNRLIQEDFQLHRNNCHMKCMNNGFCHYCHMYLKTLKILKENEE